MLSLTLYYREPRKTGLSIEGIFQSVKESLSGRITIREHCCNGSYSRIKNIREAPRYASDINHITGDVNFLAIGLRRKKTILTIHDFGFYENPVHPWYVKLIYRFFWFYLPLKFVTHVTVVSQFTHEKLIRYFRFPEQRISIIPDPVKNVFRYTPRKNSGNPPVILMMGTGKHKNLDNLIEALKGSSYHLDIIGWPAKDETDKLDAYQCSYTIYNGLSDEAVFGRYVACDILFMASLYEGFGMPIIEAQAVGRPVITSNTGAMLELGKDSAYLVDPLDPAAIRSAIDALQNEQLYAHFVALGRQNAARFEINFVADLYLKLYQELVREKN